MLQPGPIFAAALLLAACAGDTVVTLPEPIQFTPQEEPENGGLDIAVGPPGPPRPA